MFNSKVAENDVIANNIFGKALESYSNICEIYSCEDMEKVINNSYSQYVKSLFSNINDIQLYKLVKFSCVKILKDFTYADPQTTIKVIMDIYDKVKEINK